MPNIIIHEQVGYYLSKKINKNSYDYYLGLLAPDTPNLNGFGPKEERWMAHQRKKDYDEWRKSLNDFYTQEKNNYNEDFLIGYYIHILTDIIYDDYLYLKVRKKILKDYSLEESHQIMRDDMEKYYFDGQEEIIKILLSGNKSYDILNINSKDIILWKNKEIKEFKENNECKYITKDIIDFLEQQVYNELIKQIDL